MSQAGSHSGAYVMDADIEQDPVRPPAGTPRSLASNTKLFTSSAVLGRYGPSASLATALLGSGSLDSAGRWRGNIYLRGGGDPTFGSRSFARRAYGSDASVEVLADELDQAGFKVVTGSVYGDESAFDSLRGGPDSNYATDIWVGPLSAIGFDRGLANSNGTRVPEAAAPVCRREAERGAQAARHPGARQAPDRDRAGGLRRARRGALADVSRLLKLQNKHSDNYFAEMLAKGLPMAPSPGGSLRRANSPMPVTPTPEQPATATPAETPATIGTTKGGARVSMAFARSLGVRVNLVDGSGLSRSDQASPRDVAHLLDAMRDEPGFSSLYASLPIAGRDGTLATRMRSGAARGDCHAKTGTLTGVSALSGYCRSRSGRTLVFSVLNTGMNLYTAHAVQDRVAQALAGWGG